jgi:hypothetical protein
MLRGMTIARPQGQAPTLGYFNYGPEKLKFSLPPVGNLIQPHSVPKGPLGLVQGLPKFKKGPLG